MMPTLVPSERIGRLSGSGWATGCGVLLTGLALLARVRDSSSSLF
jgi:hypothetical protein